MISDQLKELERAKVKVAALEASIEAKLRDQLRSLPQEYGFESLGEFVKALREAARGRRGRKVAKAGLAKASRKRRRAKITDDTRAEVKKLVTAGKTGAEIAKATGISLPSVQNIKKALGLTKERK